MGITVCESMTIHVNELLTPPRATLRTLTDVYDRAFQDVFNGQLDSKIHK